MKVIGMVRYRSGMAHGRARTVAGAAAASFAVALTGAACQQDPYEPGWPVTNQNMNPMPPPMRVVVGGGADAAAPVTPKDLAAMCAGASVNTLLLSGDSENRIHPGLATYDKGGWSARTTRGSGTHITQVRIVMSPEGAPSKVQAYVLTFSTEGLKSPIATGTYENAYYPAIAEGRAGVEVARSDLTCPYNCVGRFEIVEANLTRGADATKDKVNAFAAGFESAFEGVTAKVRGCVSYRAP